MNSHVSVITIGVADMERAKQFYGEGLGWPIQQDYGVFVTFKPREGSSTFALYPRESLATDAGVPADGAGFSGVVLSYLVPSEERVAEVMAEAEHAGATVIKPAEQAQWGRSSGHFADPDGHIWKVASGSGDHTFAE